MVVFEETQFYLIFMFMFWCYMLYLAQEKDAKYLYYLQFVIQIPVFLALLSESYLNNLPYGYLLGFSVCLVGIYFVFIGFKLKLDSEKEN